jgi:hypothetical protein
VQFTGYDPRLGIVEEEPSAEGETVLTINLTVAGDLEPVWSLVSARALLKVRLET